MRKRKHPHNQTEKDPRQIDLEDWLKEDETRRATMSKAVHFVGFKDERFNNARKVWRPDFIHRFWDYRAVAEVAEGDIVIFANATETQPVNPYTYDDSAYF